MHKNEFFPMEKRSLMSETGFAYISFALKYRRDFLKVQANNNQQFFHI